MGLAVDNFFNHFLAGPVLYNYCLVNNCRQKIFYVFEEAEFKEFEPRLKFKPPLKYGWFLLKLYSIFQDLSRRSIETDFWRI